LARGHRCTLLLLACFVSSTAAGVSAADEPAPPAPASAVTSTARSVRKPAGVPDDYLLTLNGFFHPSCVKTLRSDEVLGSDLVIRGRGGLVRERVSPCAYRRYSRGGVRVAEAYAPASSVVSPTTTPSRLHAHDTYDGWLVFFDYTGSIDTGSSLGTQWIVPAPPTNVGNQDIAFFNDFETNDYILQPVLDFSELPGQWAIESENCCPSGNDYQSDLVAVSPGDVIQGIVTATGCDASGVCSSWTVTTTDLTTGMSTVLNTSTYGEVVNELDPGVLETYDVTSCDMLPANGEVTFYDNSLTTPEGATVNEPYTFFNCVTGGGCGDSVPASLPTSCGYGGYASDHAYTLLFGTSPTPIGDAGDVEGDAATESSDAGDGSDGSSEDDAGESIAEAGSRDAPPPTASSPPTPMNGGDPKSGANDDTWGKPSVSGCACAAPGARSETEVTWKMAAGFVLGLSIFVRRRMRQEF
jgi:hypothetical protein